MADQLEELLRRSLHTEAERVEPAGDGLRRIRERTARPSRGWSRWRTRTLVLAGAVAMVAALVAVPAVLPRLTPADSTAAAPTPPAWTQIPGAGVTDMRTVWPYPTRADGFRSAPADQAAGTYGDLSKPDRVAVRFIGSYLGPGSLSARSRGAQLAGIRIEVSRGGTPISLVYLVRVRVGDDAPYVVVEAQAPDGSLTLDPVAAPASGPVTVRGTLARAARLEVRVRGAEPVGGPLRAGAWSRQLAAGRPTAVTALATGPDGVTAFAARPVG